MTTNRPLRVFLCHSSQDKPAVRELYQKLRAESWIQPWLDEEELYPGQDWNMEIEKAVEAADAIIVCLTRGSITKEGYVQRELRIVLDFADYKPEGTLYIIPARLEACEPPRRLRAWQYADYFEGQRERALERLLVSLKRRADSLELKPESSVPQKEETPKFLPIHQISSNQKYTNNGFLVEILGGIEFVRVPAGKFLMGSDNGNDNERPQHTVDIPYDYWIGRFTVTNEQYNFYARVKGIKHPVVRWEKKKDNPFIAAKLKDVMGYCTWLNECLKIELPLGLMLRLPTEAEWEKAARGTDGREYPWGNIFDKNNCNSEEGGNESTTPVGLYSPQGDSPYGCTDMAGNVWEWTHSEYKAYPYNANDGREEEKESIMRMLRGSSVDFSEWGVRCASRKGYNPLNRIDLIGFRVAIAPKLPQ